MEWNAWFIRRYAAYIFVGGFVGKQLVWELAQHNIKEQHDRHNREAQQHLEKVMDCVEWIECLPWCLRVVLFFAHVPFLNHPHLTFSLTRTHHTTQHSTQAYADGRRLAALKRAHLAEAAEEEARQRKTAAATGAGGR